MRRGSIGCRLARRKSRLRPLGPGRVEASHLPWVHDVKFLTVHPYTVTHDGQGQQQRLFENRSRALGPASREVQHRHGADCTKAGPRYGQGTRWALERPVSYLKRILAIMPLSSWLSKWQWKSDMPRMMGSVKSITRSTFPCTGTFTVSIHSGRLSRTPFSA
jgi:hypothetical protein